MEQIWHQNWKKNLMLELHFLMVIWDEICEQHQQQCIRGTILNAQLAIFDSISWRFNSHFRKEQYISGSDLGSLFKVKNSCCVGRFLTLDAY